MKSGQSTHGYGKSKEMVMSYIDKKMASAEIAKACGLSYSAVYNVFRRMGIQRLNLNRNAHGYVKETVLTEHANGLTPSEIRKKYNFSRNSVYSVYAYLGIQYHKRTK
jgi:Mor family transcriptional regulator